MEIAQLTQRQQKVLSLIAIGMDGGHPAAILKALEAEGLIMSYEEQVFGRSTNVIDRIPVIVTRYEVPLPVHIAWAQWCVATKRRRRLIKGPGLVGK